MIWTSAEVAAAVEKLGELASRDCEFRSLCLNDPARAIRQATGKTVPQGYKIRIIENSPGFDATFVLPDLIRSELSDDELDRVAGGRGRKEDCSNDSGSCYTKCTEVCSSNCSNVGTCGVYE